ncbi:hypothetical protein [Amycolatopsis anabasis]|uniref:hypothetical protein n=1 Tax=Amycolatopsis anabasis TaxID=1840409 RepID=UPI001FE71647|nr:hypothetical protein [Amycolatopsis anabasis]
MPAERNGLVFGIYPGGAAGDDSGGLATGAPDDPHRISAALDRLQGRSGRPFLVRAYVSFTDATPLGEPHPTATPADAARYTGDGRALDLVAQYQSASGNVTGYCAFLRELVAQYGAVTSTLQVTEEPNMTDQPTLDGYYPAVAEALVAGVSAAKAHARRLGHDHLRIGFNTTPLFGPATSFVAELTRRGGPGFVADLDYVGLDFFPDVFRPLAAAELPGAVEGLLGHHRDAVLGSAGLGDVPLHVTEHGWPTGPGRPPARQAEVVDTVIRVIAANASRLRIGGYTHFTLRDADSANPDPFHQFGLTADDYSPKPAFDTYRVLIDEFSGGH